MFRDYLLELRKEKNLSQARVAESMGRVQSYYAAIEHGDRQQDMDFSIMEALAKTFEIPIEAIMQHEAEYRKQRDTA